MVNPHGMDPQTVLRFVKTVGGWPGKVVVVACEPAGVEEMGLGLSPEVEGAVERAVGARPRDDRRAADRRRLRGDGGVSCMHELSIVERDRRHGAAPRRRPPRDVGRRCASAPCARSSRTRSTSTSRSSARDTLCEGARLELELVGRLAAAARSAAASGTRRRRPSPGHGTLDPTGALPTFRCPGLRLAGAPRWSAATSSRWSRSRSPTSPRSRPSRLGGERMHRTKIRVAEDALDANETIARANRDDFDRAAVSVVNLMSAPGAGKTTLLERALDGPRGRSRRRARGRRAGHHGRRPDRAICTSRSPSSTPTPASAASATSTPTWSARRSRRCRSTRSTCW